LLVSRLPIIKGWKAKESEILSSFYTSSETTAFCPSYIRSLVTRVGHPEFETYLQGQEAWSCGFIPLRFMA